MREVEWTDDLSVGIQLIDDQHKMLIERLNNLATAVERHHGPESEEDGDEELGCVFLCHHCFSPKSPEGLTIRTAAMSR